MELVSVLLEGMLLIDLLEIVTVVGALVIDAFVDTEAGTVLDRDKGVAAVRTLVLHRFGVDAATDESGAADFALILTVPAIVVIEVHVRSTAYRADLVCRNDMAAAATHRFKLLAITMPVVSQEELPVLFEERDDGRKLVDLELLVLWRFGIIMDPLRDGYEFTDKLQQKCDLFGLMLNDVKKIEYNVHEQLNPFAYEVLSQEHCTRKGGNCSFLCRKDLSP